MPRRRRVPGSRLKPQKATNGQWYANIGPPRSGSSRASKVYAPLESKDWPESRAWKWLEQQLLAADARKVDEADPTVFGLMQFYLAWAEGRVSLGLMVVGQYRSLCSRLTLAWETLGLDRRARDVTHMDLDEACARWRSEGYSDHYRKNVVRAIRAAYRWGAKPGSGGEGQRLLAEDPLEGYEAPRLPDSPDRYVEAQVVRRFHRWAWARARARTGLRRRFDRLYLLMLRFLRLTGSRPGEACALRWPMIDWDGQVAELPPEVTKGRRHGKGRTIHLTPPVVRLLRAVERLEGRHPVAVFTHMRGTRAKDRGQGPTAEAGGPWPSGSASGAKLRLLRAEAIAAGLPGLEAVGARRIVQYTHRHVYASDALMGGLSPSEAAALLGNSASVVESTYGKIQASHAARRARELAEKRRGRSG